MSYTVLELIKVSKEPSKSELGTIQSLEFQIKRGEILSILGMGRWERHTLIDLISALDFPDHGRIFFNGTDLSQAKEKTLNLLRGKMSIITDPPIFLNNVKIWENLRLPLRYHSKHNTKEIDALLTEIIHNLGLGVFPDVIPSNFDHRFLGAAALVRALSTSPDLLVLERPLECLGERTAFRLPEIEKKYVTNKGGSVLVLTSIPKLARGICHRIAHFERGSITSFEKGNGLDR
jgi:ABC-type methionine transport system ATPase subunit